MPYNEKLMLMKKYYSENIKETLTKKLKKHEINIIMGDFIAKVGKGRVWNVAGRLEWAIGSREVRGSYSFAKKKS